MYHATHRIPTSRLADLQKFITRMNNKVAKSRVAGSPVTAEVVKEQLIQVGISEATKRPIMREYSWVTIHSAQKFQLEGHRFVGRYDFERDVEGGTVCYLHAVEGEVIPAELRETSPHCDHCATNRFRKNTFLVLNEETGEFLRFGRACLKDIFPVSAAQIAALFEWVREPNFRDYEEPVPGWRDIDYKPLTGVLAWTIAVFNQDGFVSKRVAEEQDRRATSSLVGFLMADEKDLDQDERARQKQLRDKYAADVSADIDLLLKLIAESQDTSEYIEKLQKVVRQGHVSPQNFALLVSSVTLLKRHRYDAEKAVKAANTPDVVEGRYEIEGVVVSYRSEPGYGYYSPDVLKMLVQDDQGRKYWGTCPTHLDINQGDRIRVTATVTQGQKDPKFGIFKRPVQGTNLTEEAA